VANALEQLNEKYKITKNELEILNAEKVIFPGVGEASFAVRQLHKLNLFSALRLEKKPLLGICLGMQLMADFSSEGNVTCLGIFPGEAKIFDRSKTKVPHMGWNDLEFKVVPNRDKSKLFEGINNGAKFYFAHSYYLPENQYSTSTSDNGIKFSASMERENFYGVQFHPEKSADAGLKLLRNFIELC
ncbi:MAG TPA: imidazole glycerol phosphate synthase subunit HisH, partial [Ignavibacteriaceae bacterium]|nr:imidazole glycerol phosphate synthase subunit HisH [Ignavibacteriaceae bacterium]